MRAASWAAAVTVGVVVTGCTAATEGVPIAGDPTRTSPRETSTTVRSPSFSNTQLCGLLTSEEAQSLGASRFGEAGYSIRDGHPQCQWGDETSLTVGFQDGVVVGDGPTGPGITNTPATIAGVEVLMSHLVEPNREFCQYMFDLSDDSMLSAGASVLTRGEGKYVPCDVAERFIDIIIPKVIAR